MTDPQSKKEKKANNMSNKDEQKVKEIEYLSSLSKKKGARVMAWICLVILAGLFISTIILGIIGSRYFMGMLALSILAPIFMYIYVWVGKVISQRNSDR